MNTTTINKIRLLSKIKNLSNLKGEDALTNQIAQYLRAVSLEGKLKGVWFHVPNESVVSERNKLTDIIRIKRKQSMGLINGAPDFVFVSPEKTVFIELKVKGGSLSEYQKLFREWCESEQITYTIARSLGDVISILATNNLINENKYS